MTGEQGGPPEPSTKPLSARGEERTRPLPLVLRVASQQGDGGLFRLPSGQAVVGSAQSCDFVLNDRTVSRSHAEVTVVAEGLHVRDVGSRNGTFVGARRVDEALIRPGFTVRFGKVVVQVECDGTLFSLLGEHPGGSYHGLIGHSQAMRRLFAQLERLEGSLAHVLIEGEAGAGKSAVARALHAASMLSTRPFVVFPCNTVKSEVVVDELFGRASGAFSWGGTARCAYLAADAGTLLLDEVGALPVEAQDMLASALETGEVRSPRGGHPKPSRARVLCTTTHDLKLEAQQGRLRAELLPMLSGVRVRVPSLRERQDDIEALSLHFAHESGEEALPRPVLAELKLRPWPGNVRELASTVSAFAELGSVPRNDDHLWAVVDSALGQVVDPRRPYAEQRERLLVHFERAYAHALWAQTGGNVDAASRLSQLPEEQASGLLEQASSRRGLSAARVAPC